MMEDSRSKCVINKQIMQSLMSLVILCETWQTCSKCKRTCHG